MEKCRFLILAALLAGIAAPVWSGESDRAQKPASSAVSGKPQTQGAEYSHRQKRRDAQKRLKKAIEERNARKMTPGADVAAPATVKGGTR